MNRAIHKYLLIIFNVTILVQCSKEDPNSPETVLNHAPWATTLPQLKPIAGVGGVKASDCAQCHQEIYDEWKVSTHAHALSDLQFQSELAKQSSPEWLCLNCHIPVANQRENLVIKLTDGDIYRPVFKKNPDFDPEMRLEAVTCATCHVIQNEKGESVIVGANGNLNAPHPVVHDPDYVNNRCNDCHNQTAILTDTLVCSFQTGDELQDSELNGQSCASCHMPQVNRSFVKESMNRPVRKSHTHRFIGGGVPKEFHLYAHQTIRDKRATGGSEWIGYKPGLNISLKDVTRSNKKITVSIQLKNLATGHYVPTGDPERYILIETDILNSDGNILETRDYRIGQEWVWEPKATKVSDNRLKHNEVRKMDFSFQAYSSFRRIRIRATHVRLSDKNAEYMEYTYNQADAKYKSKIKNLRQHYPTETLFFESFYTSDGDLVKETPLIDLMLKKAR